ncbi:MAG: PIN domain-containing protein [Candidatus Dormiibacterota bacterium]
MSAEIHVQKEALNNLIGDLTERAGRLSAAPGELAVLDTNVFLQSPPIRSISWKDVLGWELIRLVVPLRVVEELDEKKYAPRGGLRFRARRAIRDLDELLNAAGAPGLVGPGVTIEVPVDQGPRRRPADADEEILEDCLELALLTGREVTLVTRDTAMRLRAEALQIPTRRMPELEPAVPGGQEEI